MPKKGFFIRKNGVTVAIVLTIILVGVSSLFIFYSQYREKKLQQVEEETEEVIARLNKIDLDVGNMDKGVRGFIITPDDKFLYPYHISAGNNVSNFDTLSLLLKEQGYPNMTLLVKARNAVSTYHSTLEQIITLKRADKEEELLSIYNEDSGYQVWMTYDKFVSDAQAFERSRLESASAQYQQLANWTSITQILLALLGIPTLFFVIHRIRSSDQGRQKLFQDLEASRQQYLFNDKAAIETKNERNIIERLIANLETASDFIKNISKGDYSVEWEGLTDDNRADNRESLAGELIAMRDQMKQVKEDDQRRLWNTEGLSRVAEITRKDQEDSQMLADHVISYLVKYLSANQGALYFLEEDSSEERHLSMIACYAYDKKKFAEKKIVVGQGLVGQTFVEAKTLHLTKIPANYVAITSGLGEATPSSLLIIPLKFNEQTVGAIELASFSFFQPYQIKFLEEVGEIIASSFATVQINAKTKMLLEQSQQQAEEMRAQEEEVRQNMEELQATQEQMQRRTQELENIKENLEQKQEEIEQVRLVQQKRAEEQIKARNKMLAQAMEKAKQREIALQNEVNELRTKINEPL